VVAFEAFPGNARLLARMAKWSGVASRITVENIAISDGTQSGITLYPGRGSVSEEWNIIGHDLDGNKTEAVVHIPATSLDNYFTAGSPVHFVKIDIEGAGALALHGMRRILQESRPFVLVEFHDENEWSGREELLASRYDLYDMKGKKLDPTVDVRRVYHCLACPAEKEFNL
jgi:FkbM family methyltransferase